MKLPLEDAAKELLPKAYDDIAHPPAEQLGKALGTLSGIINMLLAPIERAQLKSQEKTRRIVEELVKSYEEIPEEQRVEAPINLIEKTFNALRFVEDETIQLMYVKLLTSSMNTTRRHNSHIAFVDILNQMNYYDAILLKETYTKKPIAMKIPVSHILTGWNPETQVSTSQGRMDIEEYSLIRYLELPENNPLETEPSSAGALAISNLLRLGIIELLKTDDEFIKRILDNILYKEGDITDDYEKSMRFGLSDLNNMDYVKKQSKEKGEYPSELLDKMNVYYYVKLTHLGHNLAYVCLPDE